MDLPQPLLDAPSVNQFDSVSGELRMLRPGPDQEIVPSVLYRLIGQRSAFDASSCASRPNHLNQLKEAVKRDLEWLFNSKQSVAELPDDLQHLDMSLLTYGLPDLTSSSLSDGHDRDRLRRALEDAIGRFEPRLSGVVVTLAECRASDRTLRFRIDGVLRIEPAPECVTFDSMLRLDTKAFDVQSD